MNEDLIRQSEALAPRLDGYRRRALIVGALLLPRSPLAYHGCLSPPAFPAS